MARQVKMVIVLLLLVVAATCSEPGEVAVDAPKASKPLVSVSTYPLQYFVERIASSQVEVEFPASVSDDPAHWRPTTTEIATLQQSDLILINGASYEQWLSNVTLPESKLTDTSKEFSNRLIVSEETVTHSHGPEGEHEHRGTAFTTWLDLQLAVAQARSVRDALTDLLPEQKETFQDRFSQLESDLLELDTQLAQTISLKPETKVVFSHPVYQYFERRYGVRGVSVHWEPDAVPDAAMWEELRNILQQHPATGMIWEAPPLPEVSEALQQLGIRSTVFDPCGNRPDSGDFLTVMTANMDSLKQVFHDSD